jgi:hypothetical protein
MGTGVKGTLLTSTVDGFTDHSIFLPFTGRIDGTTISDDLAEFWTANLSVNNGENAIMYSFDSRCITGAIYRCKGLPVRPVAY